MKRDLAKAETIAVRSWAGLQIKERGQYKAASLFLISFSIFTPSSRERCAIWSYMSGTDVDNNFVRCWSLYHGWLPLLCRHTMRDFFTQPPLGRCYKSLKYNCQKLQPNRGKNMLFAAFMLGESRGPWMNHYIYIIGSLCPRVCFVFMEVYLDEAFALAPAPNILSEPKCYGRVISNK